MEWLCKEPLLYCRKEWAVMLKNSPLKMTDRQVELVLERLQTKGVDDCWTWSGYHRRIGKEEISRRYPVSAIPGDKKRTVSRILAIAIRGDLLDGVCVCHKCDNPNCVNPNHLWLGSIQENNLDRMIKGRGKGCRHSAGGLTMGQTGERNHQAKLRDDEVRAIRWLRDEYNIDFNTLGRLFGVSFHTARSVAKGYRWKHLK